MMMKRLVVLCCAFATLLSAVTYQADFRTEEGRKEWKPNPLVTTGPDGFVLASEDALKTVLVNRKMELETFAGQFVRLSFEARAEKITKGTEAYHGAKVEFTTNTPGGPDYFGIQLPFGDTEWKTFEKLGFLPADAMSIDLKIMLQQSTGKFLVRNVKVTTLGVPLPVSSVANMELKDEKEEDNQGGWTDQGPAQDGRQFASAMKKINFEGIPFKMDPQGKCVIVLHSKEHFPIGPKTVDIPVAKPAKYRNLYLLHTMAWPGRDLGFIRIRDINGKTHRAPVAGGTDLEDWYNGRTQLSNGFPAVLARAQSQHETALFVSRFPIPLNLGPIAKVSFDTLGYSVWLVVGATLSTEDLPIPELKPYIIQENDEWRPAPYVGDMRVEVGSVLDRTPYAIGKSVDELGRVIIRDGHFWYEKDPQRRALFHVNPFHPSQFTDWSHEYIDKWIDEIDRNGYNMIRPHFLDEGLLLGAKQPLQFNEKVWDNFEYMVSLCRKRGIYIMFDAMTSWLGYTPGSVWSKAGRDPRVSFKWRIAVDPAIRENWSKGVEKLLLHKNKYTGLTLAEDPVLAITIAFNEQEFGFLQSFVSDDVAPFWRDFLKKKYGTIEKLNAAWSEEGAKFDSFSQIPVWTAKRYNGVKGNDAAQFIYGLESDLMRWYASEMKRFGATCPVTGFNVGKNMYYNMLRKDSDYVAMNAYHSHPVGSTVAQISAISTAISYARQFAITRLTGKPFVISEHNIVFWNKYRYEQAFGTGAFAALQDYEAVTVHAEPISLIMKPNIWCFRTSKDPVMRACEYLTYFLFRRRDVQPAHSFIRVRVNEKDVFTPDGPKGGMPGDLARSCLVSQLSLECVGEDGKTLPVGKNEIVYKMDQSSAVTVGQGYMETQETQASMGEILTQLKQRGFLSAKNRSDGTRFFESDTDEIFLDLEKNYMEVNTPRLQGICGLAGTTAKLPNLEIHKITQNGNLSIVSVDGNAPLQDAKRMTLVYATNALNAGMTFRSDDMTVYTDKGGLPTLVLCGQFEVSITNKNAAKLNLYPLDFAGKRLKKIAPTSVQGDTARFAVDMRNDGHAFFYELSVN